MRNPSGKGRRSIITSYSQSIAIAAVLWGKEKGNSTPRKSAIKRETNTRSPNRLHRALHSPPTGGRRKRATGNGHLAPGTWVHFRRTLSRFISVADVICFHRLIFPLVHGQPFQMSDWSDEHRGTGDGQVSQITAIYVRKSRSINMS